MILFSVSLTVSRNVLGRFIRHQKQTVSFTVGCCKALVMFLFPTASIKWQFSKWCRCFTFIVSIIILFICIIIYFRINAIWKKNKISEITLKSVLPDHSSCIAFSTQLSLIIKTQKTYILGYCIIIEDLFSTGVILFIISLSVRRQVINKQAFNFHLYPALYMCFNEYEWFKSMVLALQQVDVLGNSAWKIVVAPYLAGLAVSTFCQSYTLLTHTAAVNTTLLFYCLIIVYQLLSKQLNCSLLNNVLASYIRRLRVVRNLNIDHVHIILLEEDQHQNTTSIIYT